MLHTAAETSELTKASRMPPWMSGAFVQQVLLEAGGTGIVGWRFLTNFMSDAKFAASADPRKLTTTATSVARKG